MTDPTKKSFAKSLFYGNIPEELVFPYPRVPLAEQADVRRLLAGIHELPVDPRTIDEQARIPAEVLSGMKRLGLFGLAIPVAYGGAGLSQAAACRVYQEVAARDAAMAATLLAHGAVGSGGLLLFGTEAQRRLYLPRLATGELVAAFCQAESQSGSDASAIRSRAQPAPGGEDFLLHGSKLWVTNGGFADLLTLFAQTEVVRDGARVDRISAFLIERGQRVRAGAEEPKLGVRGASTTALYLDDVVVPRTGVLGSIGGGFKVAMDTVNRGRPALSACCVGLARLLRLSLQHATSRRQFGRLLSSFGMIKDKLARMQLDLYAAESMVYLTAGLFDRNGRNGPSGRSGPGAESDCALESACCKVFASEMLWRVASEAMNLAAGAGFMCDYPYERFLRDARFFLVFLGTNEVLRCYIALTGMQGPGEQLDKLADAIKHPLRGYGLVVDSLLGQVRSAAYGGPALSGHHPRLRREAGYIEDGVEALQKGVDRVLRRYGRQISEMQYVQWRVADVAIDLYAMIAGVSRCSAALVLHDARRAAGEGREAAGELDHAERELRLCRVFCHRAKGRIRAVLERFNDNDDELMKGIADESYHGRPYPLDAVLD